MKIDLSYCIEKETKNYAKYELDSASGDVIRPDGETGYSVIPDLYVEKDFLFDKVGHIPDNIDITVSFDN